MSGDFAPTNLTNHFLIAMPGLQDAIFSRSVVYLCEHSERGALGLVINKPCDIDLKRLFEKVPAFASTKSNIGHTLGAAGAIEAVYCILNLMHQEVYQNLRFEKAIEATGLTPVTGYQKMELEHVMSNSFGFGGNCSSLIFSKG